MALRIDQTTAWVIFGITAIPLIVLLRRIVMRRYTVWQAEALISIGRCPTCQYNLKGVNAESDGCATCSECGSAWRRS